MKLSFIIIAVSAAGLGFALSLGGMDSEDDSKAAFHARLADPAVYENGVFADQVTLKPGDYEFGFVPNGDSPRILSIVMLEEGRVFFSEDFELEGTEQGTETASYFTWDYQGRKQLSLSEETVATVQIDPHGNTLGPVTVEMRKLP